MTKVTLVCLQKDLDATLNVLNEFGQFHIERPRNMISESYGAVIEEAQRTSARLNSMMEQLKIGKQEPVSLFKYEEIRRIKLSVEDWISILQSVSREVSILAEEISKAFKTLEETNQKTDEIQKLAKILRILERFNINPQVLNELRSTHTVIATAPLRNVISLGRALSSFPTIYHYEEISPDIAFIFLATTMKNSQMVEKILKTYDVKPFPRLEKIDQDPSQALSTIQDQLRELSEKKESALQLIQKVTEKYRVRLMALREVVWNVENTLKVKEDVFKTRRLVQMVGYVPETSLSHLERYLKESLGDHFILFSSHHVELEDPPTALQNSSLVKPFEMITKLYGLPHYDEVDPTPIMAVTFPLIFGLMFGDLGQGLILFLGGLSLSFMIKSPDEWRSFCRILAACGLGSILAGFLFGEAFGKQIVAALWIDPFENIITFLIFSLLVGAFQIMIGFVLNFTNFMLKGEYVDALTVSLPKMILYAEALYFLMKYALDFDLWLSGPIFYLAATLVFLFLSKPVFFSFSRRGKFIPILGERLFEGSELLLSLLSNTMSYARILALLMAHWALLTATYAVSSLASTLPIFGRPIELIMIIGGNIAVMAFEGLIVFIHTLRLHFYEWFSKFYEGTGTAFQPFKYQEKYVEIEVLNSHRKR